MAAHGWDAMRLLALRAICGLAQPADEEGAAARPMPFPPPRLTAEYSVDGGPVVKEWMMTNSEEMCDYFGRVENTDGIFITRYNNDEQKLAYITFKQTDSTCELREENCMTTQGYADYTFQGASPCPALGPDWASEDAQCDSWTSGPGFEDQTWFFESGTNKLVARVDARGQSKHTRLYSKYDTEAEIAESNFMPFPDWNCDAVAAEFDDPTFDDTESTEGEDPDAVVIDDGTASEESTTTTTLSERDLFPPGEFDTNESTPSDVDFPGESTSDAPGKSTGDAPSTSTTDAIGKSGAAADADVAPGPHDAPGQLRTMIVSALALMGLCCAVGAWGHFSGSGGQGGGDRSAVALGGSTVELSRV